MSSDSGDSRQSQETVYEPCEACAGRGEVERTRERRCGLCNVDKTIEEDGREVLCPNCGATGREQRTVKIKCKVCDKKGETPSGEVPCENCDRRNEEVCSNCDGSITSSALGVRVPGRSGCTSV